MSPESRLRNATTICLAVIGSWYWMLMTHELGHVLGALLTGGRVQRVVLEFLAFSRTDVEPNPHPAIVVWAGPVFGSLAPLLAFAAVRRSRLAFVELERGFAGFCLLANGAYIGIGSLSDVGDAGDMISLGSPPWTLWAFGAISAGLGLWLWHKLDFTKLADSLGFAMVHCISALLVVAVF